MHLKAIYEINPLNGIFLQQLLDSLREFDRNRIFYEPVDAKEVPGYYETIKQPMDFSKMQHKLNNMQYDSLSQFEADYNLIIANCLQFNQKNSFFYKLAFKMREQVRFWLDFKTLKNIDIDQFCIDFEFDEAGQTCLHAKQSVGWGACKQCGRGAQSEHIINLIQLGGFFF